MLLKIYNRFQIEYQNCINKLRMCRADLDEETIAINVQNITEQVPESIIEVLHWCINLAMEGSPMPWEKE